MLQSMVGTSTKEITSRKANQAVTLCSRSTVKVNGEPVNRDPKLIFKIMIPIRDRSEDAIPLFQYELCTYPATLLKSSPLPLQPQRRRFFSITSERS